MSAIQLLIDALAVYRLTLLISKDKGPGFIFQKLRAAPPKKSSLKQGLSCPFCISIWIAAPVAWYACNRGEFYLNWPRLTAYSDIGLLLLGLSGAAIIFNQAFTKGEI